MFRQLFTRAGVPAVIAAALLTAGPARAQHHGGGAHGGGFHGGSSHVGSFHPGSFHGGSSHVGSFHPGSFHRGSFHHDGFHSNRFHRGVFFPGSYYGSYPPSSYYPSYDLGYGSAPGLGYLDSYGEAAPSYSSGYQGLEPPSTVSADAASAQADSTAHVTVRVPADAELWFEGSLMTSAGSVREFRSPPLEPGRYTYHVRARWTENDGGVTQTQEVAVSPGAHVTVDFPIRSGTD
jgi:uncharacterized protein (TIGR03000 family)